MKCPNCQAENREDAQFCGECAQPPQSETAWQNCGRVNLPGREFCDLSGRSRDEPAAAPAPTPAQPPPLSAPDPTSFANGRYQVRKLLGEGGKKKVCLAQDTVLDRDVAFALITTEAEGLQGSTIWV